MKNWDNFHKMLSISLGGETMTEEARKELLGGKPWSKSVADPEALRHVLRQMKRRQTGKDASPGAEPSTFDSGQACLVDISDDELRAAIGS